MPARGEKDLSILKVLFGKRSDGKLAIQNMTAVPLRRGSNAQPDFYPILDDILVAQPNYASTILSTLGQSIVPVVAIVAGEDRMRCLGTGFFVSAEGLLVTAAHVVTDPIERRYGAVREIDESKWLFGDMKLGVMIPTNPMFGPNGWIFRPIEWAEFLAERTDHPLPLRGVDLKLTSDTAICKVITPPDAWLYQPLTAIQPGIRGLGLAVGKTATAIGYAGMQDVVLEQQPNGGTSGDFKFKLHVSRGEILEHLPDNGINRQVQTPGACFSASLKLPAGMSGSPIFDDERIYVHGVVSMGWEDQNGPMNHGYGSMLAQALSLPIGPLGGKSFTDLMPGGGAGIPILSIPDA